MQITHRLETVVATRSSIAGFSDVLQQLSMSKFQDEHAERFLNQFAATTLVRYISAILQFLQICRDMQVSLDQLSESNLADLLICGSLARRADGTGPKSSITIKAVRWAFTHLGVKVFACAYGSMITSFSKQKIPSDRKESLPLPLFHYCEVGEKGIAIPSFHQGNHYTWGFAVTVLVWPQI